MCRSVRCKTCGKTTWAGCGMHVQQVMAGVAREDRCGGHAPAERGPGFLARMFGR